jgi:hypothetical protein
LRINCSVTIALRLLMPTIGDAQSISFGIRGYAETKETFLPTVPLDSSFGFHPVLNRYSIGSTFELALPRGFAIQFDALRSRLEYREEFSSISPSRFSTDATKYDTVGHSWQFPLIAKNYIQTDTIFRPYPEVGFSFQRVDAVTKFEHTTVATLCDPLPINCGTTVSTGTIPPPDLRHRWTNGIVFGGGVDVRWNRFHLQPELRYTHWLKPAFGQYPVESNKNALDVVIGFTFSK